MPADEIPECHNIPRRGHSEILGFPGRPSHNDQIEEVQHQYPRRRQVRHQIYRDGYLLANTHIRKEPEMKLKGNRHRLTCIISLIGACEL
jgi:hypothetical protein